MLCKAKYLPTNPLSVAPPDPTTLKFLGCPHILKAAYKAPVLPEPESELVSDIVTPLVEV